MSQPPPVSAKPRVLVVERNFGIQHYIRSLLRDVCDAEAAFSENMARALLVERSYDLIIASVDRPRRNHGLDLLKAVQASPEASSIPLIGLTRESLVEDADALPADGFAALLPIWPELRGLRAIVLHILESMEAPAGGAVDDEDSEDQVVLFSPRNREQ